jgi:hypothetical protein
LSAAAPACAQSDAINDLKGNILDAKMAQKTFANGLKYCSELDGKHFYFLPRDRVLDLRTDPAALFPAAAEGLIGAIRLNT